METASGPEQPDGLMRCCPFCGAAAAASARFCPACGRAMAGAGESADISNWISAGWALFSSNILMAIAIPLVLFAVVFGFLLAGYFGFIVTAILSDQKSGSPAPVVLIAMGVLWGVVLLVWAAAVPALQGGVYACFLQGTRTGELKADRLWTGFRRWWACTWVSWALGGAIVICLPLMFLLIGIPLILGLLTLHWLALFHIVDKGEGGIAALSFAGRVLRGRLWFMLVCTLIAFAVMGAGIAGMYLGVLVTAPIADAALAASYDSLSREQGDVSAA